MVLKPALKPARRPGRYIVLSLFDGVGAAVAILENLFGTPTAAMAWETDRTCRRLTSHRLPWLQQRGDFGNETVEKVVAEIRRLDPAGQCVVLMIAAPPCQDFSRIGAETGHSGTRGSRAFHPAVASSRLLLPCATTPAEDENGRPAPKRARGKIPEPARARWLADCRQFAPWHYAEEAMLHDEAGRLHNIPANVKEALHEIPAGYTDLGDGDERSRHRLVANGWHWGVARRLLAMLMALTVARPAEASVPAAPRTTTVSWMAAQFGGGPLDMSPPPRLASRLDLPEDDPDEHWRQALRLTHCTVTRRPQLEPAVERVMELIATWRHDVVRIRGEVLAEIKEMVAEWAAETEAWMAQRPAPVRSTYATADKDRPTQIPVLLELLGVVGYLTDGFDMLGEVRRGPGWKDRKDGRYQNPASLDQLVATNWEYVRRRASGG